MSTISWTSFSTWCALRCAVFVHGNVARRAENRVHGMLRAGVERGCGTLRLAGAFPLLRNRHAALMNLFWRSSSITLKGPSENYAAFDTLPAVLPSRPRTPQVLQCLDRLSSLMNRRPSTQADALPEVVQGHHAPLGVQITANLTSGVTCCSGGAANVICLDNLSRLSVW